MKFPAERNYGCRLTTGGTLKGYRTVVLENELLRVTVLVDKGTDVWEFLYKPQDVDFMWRSPMLLRDPRFFVPTSSSSSGFWYDYYAGGWQEILPSGGVPGRYKGAEYGLHGESSLIPWEFRIVEDRPEKISVAFWTRLYRSPFYIEKRLSLETSAAVLRLDEVVENEGNEPMEFMWGHHPTLGIPFLDEHCRIDTGATQVHVLPEPMFDRQRLSPGLSFPWPVAKTGPGGEVDISEMPAKTSNTADFFVLDGLESGWYAVTNQKRRLGIGMTWPKELFPYLWFWQVCGGSYEYPWYGRTYNLALEPFSSLPGGIEAACRNGTAIQIGPGERISGSLAAIVYQGTGRVKSLHPDGTVEFKP